MSEELQSVDPIVAGALEVAFPSVPPKQREAIVQGLSKATRSAIRQLVSDNNTPPPVKLIQELDGRVMIPAGISTEVRRLVLESVA